MRASTDGLEPPSEWVLRWSHLVAPGARVLDLACGHGRHARWFAERGHPVLALDRNPAALDALADLRDRSRVETVLADIENHAWPLTRIRRAAPKSCTPSGGLAKPGLGALTSDAAPRQFDAVIVTNYLWRPLFPTILRSLAPAGVLIYETFADGNASVGKPARADFLLRTGELLSACARLRIVAFEDGFAEQPDRFVQRIAAVRALAPASDAATGPPRYRL